MAKDENTVDQAFFAFVADDYTNEKRKTTIQAYNPMHERECSKTNLFTP